MNQGRQVSKHVQRINDWFFIEDEPKVISMLDEPKAAMYLSNKHVQRLNVHRESNIHSFVMAKKPGGFAS